jgi:rsbT antagonist protein RsbS
MTPMTDQNILVIKIKNILMVTVPSDPNDLIITKLQEHILNAMAQFNTKGLIMDITLVEVVDSFFARTIVETAQMVTLMGGKTVIAGMKPAVAITTTQMGFKMGNVLTALDVDRAIDLLNSIN